MPRTLGGRAIATLLVIVGVVVVVFFFAAVLVVAAVGALVWFLRSLLTGAKTRRAIKPDEVSAKYEVVENDGQTQDGRGERLLSGPPAPEPPASEGRSG
jgi:hypothetical protein